MRVIARIHSDFSTKFGVPRQSGLVDALESTVAFEPEYRNPDALRGLEDASHLPPAPPSAPTPSPCPP